MAPIKQSQKNPTYKQGSCCCAKPSETDSSDFSDSSSSSSESSETSISSEYSSDSTTTSDTTDNEQSITWECKCQKIRKRGGNKVAKARATATENHKRSKKRSSRRKRLSSSSSYSSDDYTNKCGCDLRKARRKYRT